MSLSFKKIILWLFIVIIFIIASTYLLILIFIPKILNSPEFLGKLESKIYNKTGLKLEAVDFNFKFSKSLKSNLTSKNIILKNKNNELIFEARNINLNFDGLRMNSSCLRADYIYFNKAKLNKKEKNDSDLNFNFKKLPKTDIKNIVLILNEKPYFKIDISDLRGNLKDDKYLLTLTTKIYTPFIDSSVTTNNNSKIYFKNNSVELIDFSLIVDNTPVAVKGNFNFNKKFDLKISSKGLSVAFIEKTFLYFMKQIEPDNKNFIENFYDFKGAADINLTVKNGSIDGFIDLKEFCSKYVKFSIPLYFKSARFNFNGDKITLKEKGFVGEQNAYTEFFADNLFSKNKIIKGSLIANANNEFAKKYIKDLKIIGNIDLNIEYTIFNREIIVNYLANLDKGESVIYNNAYFEKKDKKRRLFANTFKKGNIMYLKSFDYSTVEDNEIKNIFVGNGQFDRFNNKYHLNYISCKTAQATPINIFGFFNKLISGGYFEGDVQYIAKNKIITGNFSVFNTKYKNFVVKNAEIKAGNKNIIIDSNGLFENEPFKAYLNLDNTLYDKITANDINLYLKKYIIKRNPKNRKKTSPEKIVNKVKDADITIKQGKIRLDELKFKDITLNNLTLEGLIQDNMAFFDMPDIDFAKGKLSAIGVYDLITRASNIDFTAKDIDSNHASSMIFNLKNQFEGSANATLNFKSFNNLDVIDSYGEFSILDGALTKLGSKEFLLKKSKDSNRVFKFKLTDILNVNEKQIKSIRSNLNGNFNLYNNEVKNAEIFVKQKYLALYLTGKYNIASQMADIYIFGNYNKNAQKGIRVLFIPLSWITKAIFNKEELKNVYSDKINKIPEIQSKDKDKETFIVKLKGNPNENSSIKVEMRSLK